MKDDSGFTIRSADGAELTFQSPSRDCYHVQLRASSLTTDVKVYHLASDSVGQYFTDIARDWRGWEGERDWSSLERQVVLQASISKAGAVCLRVQLRDSSFDTWQIRYDFAIENGDLEGLASGARAFGQLLGALP